MRSIFQKHKNVSYIFAGSQESMMSYLFQDKSQPFFRFGIINYLGTLFKPPCLKYIKNSFYR